MELSFGWRTAILLSAALVTLPLSLALLNCANNRAANRTLALLLLTLIGVTIPWIIGFAGFYGRWQWLTFLPVALPLFVPPLALYYAHALMYARWPNGAWIGLVPGFLHFCAMFASFCLPLSIKESVAEPLSTWMNLVVGTLLIFGFCIVSLMLNKSLRRYTNWLADQRSDDIRFATRWLSRASLALAILFCIWSGFRITDILYPLGYKGLMPLYLAIAAVTVFLAVEGWRHANIRWPSMNSEVEVSLQSSKQNWAELGRQWQVQVVMEGLYRDPNLCLARAARSIGTNTNYLSRAFNDGLGMNFSAVINRIRAEAVAESIDAGSDKNLLDLALEAGFASKASFNRWFSERFGVSPSSYRQRLKS